MGKNPKSGYVNNAKVYNLIILIKFHSKELLNFRFAKIFPS